MAERSGNPNPIPNPNLAELGKDTQFGKPGGPDPVAAAKSKERSHAYSVRAALKHIAGQPISTDEGKFDEEMARLKVTANGETTLARLTAVRQFEKAIKKGDTAAATYVTENMEGKLSQELVIPSSKPAPTDCGTLEEASAAYKEFMGT